MAAVLVALSGLLGLAIGSFLNVVVWRVPRQESVVAPPSACPGCGARIRARDNVPVLSWLLLRARCRDCDAPIPARYPLIELLTGVLFVGVTLWTGLEAPEVWALPARLYLAAVAVALAFIDLDTHTLPNRIVLPSYAIGAGLLALASAGTGDWGALLRAAVGGAVLWVFYLLLVLAYPRGMGFGDVKLAGVLGLYLGWAAWGALVVGGFAAFLLGGVVGLGLLVAGRAKRGTGIPFGPWMLLGAAVGLVGGERLWALYLGGFGP